MSAPGDPAPPPGWYPDPDGAPGQVRWWNGVAWSDVTTPAGPGVEVRSSPLLAPPQRQSVSSGDLLSSDGPPRPPRSRTPWLIGAGVLALIAVLVVALVSGGSGATGGTTAADPPEAFGQTSEPPGPTFAPGTVRIIDQDAGISYPFLGDGWYEYDRSGQQETSSTAGQYFVTQENLPDGYDVFIAQCTSGPVVDSFGYSGPASLGTTLKAVAGSARGNYYPAPNQQKVLRDEDRTVDGHPAHLFEFDLSWNVAGYDATGERAAMLLVDVGRPAPALLYLSIPNTHAELYGVIDQVLQAVQVL